MANSTGIAGATQKRSDKCNRPPMVEYDQKHCTPLVERVHHFFERAVLGAPIIALEHAELRTIPGENLAHIPDLI